MGIVGGGNVNSIGLRSVKKLLAGKEAGNIVFESA
jgi:hypothetical protein